MLQKGKKADGITFTSETAAVGRTVAPQIA